MKNKIVSVIDKLEKLDIEFDDIALADALWLANEITFLETKEELPPPTSEDLDDSSDIKNDKSSNPENNISKNIETPELKTVTVAQEVQVPLSLEQDGNRQKILLGKKKDIFISNALMRSLLTFKHKVKSKKLDIVNIEKSVEVFSQTKLMQLYFKSSYENFLDIYLVIDISESMEIWQKSLEIFQNKLQHLQGFRNIIPIYLRSDEKKSKLFKDRTLTKRFNPHSINAMEKRGLIFVISDMISPAWWSTNAMLQLCVLQDKLPLAIIQMLPYNMWQDTILGNTNITTLYSSKFYPKNIQLKSMLDSQLQMVDKEYFKDRILKIPVINFTQSGFLSLGNVWRGKENKKVDGFVIGRKEIYLERKKDDKELKLTASKRVELFKKSASLTAWRLAKYLSVAGRTNVSIMQIIQSEMMPESSQIHLAECFTGGLIDKSKKQDFYQFYDGVDEILKKELGKFFVLETWQKCSDFIASEMGSSLKFNAVINSTLLNRENLNENDKIFAYMSVSTLRGLGGKYSKVADYLERHILKEEDIVIKEEQTKAIIPTSKRFQMGSNDGYGNEKPAHEVIFNYDFEIAQYLVTFEEYDIFCEETKRKKPHDENWGRGKRPVINVSWLNAKEYCKWISKKTGEEYRLPTEAEWEYSCRAETTAKWSFGDDEKELVKYAWYNSNNDRGTKSVGEKLPNPWGLYDMHGNVWEWCQDDFVDSYKKTPKDGTAYIGEKLVKKVLRGGSWSFNAGGTRSYFRVGVNLASHTNDVGFRLLKVLNEKEHIPNILLDEKNVNDDNLSELEKLQDSISNCSLCSLSKSRKNIVFGEGNPEAEVMFVGEGLGEMEDNSGRPFVGKSGELLNRIIEDVLFLKRKDVYLANIVKCRPFSNIVPTEEEIATCKPFLLKQIAIVKPKIIVALGSTSYRYLTGDMDGRISRVRGEFINFAGAKLMPTFHPAFLLRNPSAKKDVMSDMLKVKYTLDPSPKNIEEYFLNQYSEDMISLLKSTRSNELENRVFYHDSFPSDDNSATIIEFGVPEIVKIINLEKIENNEYYVHVEMKYNIGFDLHIVKSDYYTNDDIEKLFTSKEELNDHFFVVEGKAFLETKGRVIVSLDENKKLKQSFLLEITDIKLLEQIPIDQDISNELLHYDISYDCEKCSTSSGLYCNDLEWDGIGFSDRQMGQEFEHEAIHSEKCEKCENEISIIFSCWEYPVGTENMRDIEFHGIKNFYGSCCLNFAKIKEQKKIEKITAIDNIKEWFFENYEDPANSLPYISKEGGYQWTHGEPVDTEEVINENFWKKYSEEILQKAIDEIGRDEMWSPIPQSEEEFQNELEKWANKKVDKDES